MPKEYAGLFRGSRQVLASHRGYDAGALELARAAARRFDAPPVFATTTRLLVDLNRSPGHRRLFSEFTRDLDATTKAAIVAQYYTPYRHKVETFVARGIERGKTVLHLSVHSFTPTLDGELRNADVGLLYDPTRRSESAFCHQWRSSLRILRPKLRVRRNYPYHGASDGLVTALRRRFGAAHYVGIELEVNQIWPLGEHRAWRSLQHDLLESFAGVSCRPFLAR